YIYYHFKWMVIPHSWMDKGGIPAKLGIILTIVAMATLAVRILCQHVRLTMMSFNIRLNLKQCSKLWYKKGLKSWKIKRD
ncbi:hypothetical protein PIB30_100708, partial [Stylosanthes scabra]|nr:hypothetical protein [Stylosanthes scabra]